MLSLDPALDTLQTIEAGQITEQSSYSTSAIRKYNPYEELASEPKTYYECLSVLNTFTPLACPSTISYDTYCVLDLDLSGGCYKAIQDRYPRASIYSSSLSGNGDRRTPRTVKEYLLSRNRFGADFAFCIDTPEFNLERQVRHATEALFQESTLAVRITNLPHTQKVRRVIEYMCLWYQEVHAYKAATMSCVRDECYLIGRGKLTREATTPTTISGLDVVSKFAADSRASVSAGVDNTNVADVEALKIFYLGL